MEKIKRAWKRTPTPIRQALIFVIGCSIILAGLVMLVTPGPGWAGIFLGFAILATEFSFAERQRDRMIAVLKKLVKKAEKAWRKFRQK